MRSYTANRNEENKDRIKSALLSILIWAAILLFVFLYKLKPELDKDPEVVTTMLVNFGDNRNGKGIEEPAGIRPDIENDRISGVKNQPDFM